MFVLTNSENAARDTEKPVKNECGTLHDLARQPVPARNSETDRDASFFETIGPREEPEQSTNGRGNQFEAGGWLPERYIAKKDILCWLRDGRKLLIQNILR
jgi:hypothetical protein